MNNGDLELAIRNGVMQGLNDAELVALHGVPWSVAERIRGQMHIEAEDFLANTRPADSTIEDVIEPKCPGCE